MNCKVCGSAEFVTNDGITYCTECQSQVEDTQAEVSLDPTLSRDIGSSGPKKVRTQKTEEYSDWITIEGFNHVLFMQVSALIKLGASPKLKSTVLHIWSKYLQKCELAFRTDYQAEDSRPRLGPLPSKRDVKLLYGDKKISKRKMKKKGECNAEISNRKRKKPEESDTEFSQNPSTDEDPSVNDSDVESQSNASLSSESIPSKPKYSSWTRKMLRVRKPKSIKVQLNKVFNMTLSKTLSIIYLGLLYTEDQLSLLDLIRLVYEEKVPYVNLLDKLPLKMQNDQGIYHTYTVPDAHSILKTARDIMQFIKLPEYKEPSLTLSAARLVRDLNLPDHMLPIIKKLMERYKEQLFVSAPKIENIPVEYQALASIIVAMKMLFILDDKFEIEHSKAMSKLNAIYPDRKYFEWSEWKKHSMVKEFLFLNQKPGYSVPNNLDSLSANSIISKYPFNRVKPTTSEEFQKKRDLGPAKSRIIEILSDVVHIPNRSPDISTSFPLRRAIKCFMEEWRTLPMFKETKEIDFTLLNRDFSSCSLSLNPLQFDKEEDELSHLLMTTLYLPHTTVNMGIKDYFPVTYHHEVMCTTSSYWYLKWSLRDCGTSDVITEWLNKLPVSFKWLINYFSKYAHCTNSALYKEVAQMERIIVLHRWAITKTCNSRIENKVNVDF